MKKIRNLIHLQVNRMHQVRRIRIRWHRNERILAACIRLRHTGPSPDVTVWGAIGYTSRSPLVRIEGTLNSACYISGVLRPVGLHFTRALRNPTFQQDNARPHVTGIVRTFLDTENVRLFPLPTRSPDLSPIENIRYMFPSNWLVIIRQSLRLMSCGNVLKLHGHLYLHMASNLCLTQCPG
ncbi:UNVERIFIED_CONTAM: Transposable element Tcb1 transposase [Trichonephila clavipes]